MTLKAVRSEHSGPIARIRLARPDVGNAVTLGMATELAQALRDAANDDAVEAVMLTGGGRHFCVGADVLVMASQGERVVDYSTAMIAQFNEAVALIVSMGKPVVVGAQGAAVGAGLSLIAAADVAIASDEAFFSLGQTAVGLPPDGGAAVLLPRIIGAARAMHLALTNARLSASDAIVWGIVSQVVPAGGLEGDAERLAQALARLPRSATARTKRLMRPSYEEMKLALAEEAREVIASLREKATRDALQAIALGIGGKKAAQPIMAAKAPSN